jgi:hypothetical protein
MKTFKGEGISHRLDKCPLCHVEIFVEIKTGVACEVLDTGTYRVPGSAHVHPEIVSRLAEPLDHTPAEPDLPAADVRWTRGFDLDGYSEGC